MLQIIQQMVCWVYILSQFVFACNYGLFSMFQRNVAVVPLCATHKSLLFCFRNQTQKLQQLLHTFRTTWQVLLRPLTSDLVAAVQTALPAIPDGAAVAVEGATESNHLDGSLRNWLG